jgi:hypothetical protein
LAVSTGYWIGWCWSYWSNSGIFPLAHIKRSACSWIFHHLTWVNSSKGSCSFEFPNASSCWCWVDNWGSWSCWCNSSLSPLTSIVAIGSNISFNALLNKSNIISEVHWGAVFMIWDQFFTVRPDAFCNISASSNISSCDAGSPHSRFSSSWVAESLREQWILWCWINCNWSSVLSMSPLAFSIASI